MTFPRLPFGQYELVCQLDSAPAQGASRLLAKSHNPAARRRLSLDAYLQVVVHSPDGRLLATVEPDHSGQVVLTFASDAAELHGAKVQYRLLNEAGMIELNTLAGNGIWRGTRYLRQRFAPESALGLEFTIVP